MLLVSIEDVDVRLWGTSLLTGVSFALRQGESWVLLGRNGAGKSTLLRLLRGEVWPHPSSRGRRLYHFPDAEPSESPIGARERIALVSAEVQDTYLRRDWNVRVEDLVRTGHRGGVWIDEPLADDEERAVQEAIEMLGIGHLRRRRLLEVSAGEARRAFLARALALRPRALLLDEFCDGLDTASRSAALRAVSEIARAGTPVVFATHRAEEIVPEVGHAAVLEGGRLVAQGARDDVLSRWGAAAAGPAATSGPARLASSSRLAAEASPPSRDGRVLFAVHGADVRIGGRPALRGLDWVMRDGENWAVLGPNGSGKSTFLRLLAGELHPAPGGRIDRLELGERHDVWEVKARVGLVGSRLQAEHRGEASGEEVVLSGFFGSVGLGDEPSEAQRATAAACMDRLGVLHLAGRGIQSLSYGEQRKLLLARALVHDPEVLLLDEPWNGLDPMARGEMMELVQGLCRAGTRLVLVAHHEYEIVPAVNRLLELREGRAVFDGPWPRR